MHHFQYALSSNSVKLFFSLCLWKRDKLLVCYGAKKAFCFQSLPYIPVWLVVSYCQNLMFQTEKCQAKISFNVWMHMSHQGTGVKQFWVMGGVFFLSWRYLLSCSCECSSAYVHKLWQFGTPCLVVCSADCFLYMFAVSLCTCR